MGSMTRIADPRRAALIAMIGATSVGAAVMPESVGRPGRAAERLSVSGRTVTIHRSRREVYRALWEHGVPFPGKGMRIVEDQPGEQIVWRSAVFEMEGKVILRDAPGGRGTIVTAIVEWGQRSGTSGDPAVLTRAALKRLKVLIEAGGFAAARFGGAAVELMGG